MLHVHLVDEPTDEAYETLRSQLDTAVHLTFGPAPAKTAEYQVLVTGRPTQAQLNASPQLQALIVPWAGIPIQTREQMKAYPHIAVHNLHHNVVPVAETVLTLLLAAAKLTIPHDQGLRRQDWTLRYERPTKTQLLQGKTVLILGHGAIGQEVARLCSALGMQVTATRRSLDTAVATNNITIHPATALTELLPQAQVLIITLPLTPETEGLIGAAELALLPERAILVNIGRGPIVEEAALYEALRSGHLHSVGLDVWYNYPEDEVSRRHTSPTNLPFHELENVVMSPHRGGLTDETERLRMTHLAHLLNMAVRGEPMPNPIDLEKGY